MGQINIFTEEQNHLEVGQHCYLNKTLPYKRTVLGIAITRSSIHVGKTLT